jgi:hypothetical protein
MAPFWIFTDFLYFCVYGFVFATVLGGVLALIGRMLVPNTVPGWSGFLWVCFRRPFLLIPWVLLAFIAYSYANGIIFHRDNGMGIDVHVPLPDGYILGYVNYDIGSTLTPETIFGSFPNPGPGAITGVTGLQVTGPYILGSRDVPPPTRFDDWRSAESKYFLIDTRTRSVASFPTLDDLRNASASRGINLSLEMPPDVYSRYRRTWFDWSFPVVSALGLIALLSSLWREVKQIQNRANGTQELTPGE